MRGLGQNPGTAAGTAVVLAALGVLATACGNRGTGVRDEGPGRLTEPLSRAGTAPAAPATPAARVDAVRLVREDPKVDRRVRRDLKPCGEGGKYPVDVSYGPLTGGAADDVLVNVMTCGDAVGIGTYVYRYLGGRYVHVFGSETPPVYSEIDRGDLVVTRQYYGQHDPVAYPSGEEVITYRWTGGRFTVQSRIQNDYSNAVGDPQGPAAQN